MVAGKFLLEDIMLLGVKRVLLYAKWLELNACLGGFIFKPYLDPVVDIYYSFEP